MARLHPAPPHRRDLWGPSLPLAWVGAGLGWLVVGLVAAPVWGQVPTPASPSGGTPTAVNRVVRPTLRRDSQGDAVTELQSILVLLGYYNGPVSGLYGTVTEAAVQAFQRDAGITPDGIVGPATWSSLFPTPADEANPPSTPTAAEPTAATPAPAETSTETPAGTPTETPASPAPVDASMPVLRSGDSGESVMLLQERLKALGFYAGPVDGLFGAQTEMGVRRAQDHYGLEADGVVGPATWSAIQG